MTFLHDTYWEHDMDSPVSSTIGELFLTLAEMGFTEEQIQSAIQAGHFSVMDAAEWLLQGQSPRHTLLNPQPAQPTQTAIAAFNPPKDTSTSDSHMSGDCKAGTSSMVGPPQSCSTSSSDLPPVESRMKLDKSDFEEQQRQRVAQEARAERNRKKQERELVLKRIAEDRRSLQEKKQTCVAAEAPSPSDQGHRLGGTVQTNVDNNCILMIRLPTGESMRERFPADAPLRAVVEHISGRYPSLPSFSLLQGFPRKRFGEAELACSLRSLGLTPNAALCIQTTPPETPQDPPSPAEPPVIERETPPSLVLPQPQAPPQEEAGDPEPAVLPPPPLPNEVWEEAVNMAGIPGAPPIARASHHWGRGQRLVPTPREGSLQVVLSDSEEEEEEPPNLLNGMPRMHDFPERPRGGLRSRHHWPEHGNRLREAAEDDQVEPDEAGMQVAPVAAGLAAVGRFQQAAQREDASPSQEEPLPPKRPFRNAAVGSLCALATRATVQLMTAPSMQYSSSLAGLTPQLAELLLDHMTRERLLRPRTLELFFGCQLQKLVLDCYPYSTNELLRQLRAFTSLKHLSLLCSPLITDSGLSILSSLVKLQHLNLAACSKLTDSCLQHITGLKNLCFLSLDQTKVTDAGMVLFLQSAPSCLTQLSLNQTAITESTLAVLPKCVPQLRLLSLRHTKIQDVSAPAELPCLQTLILDGTKVTEDSLRRLANHPTLSHLNLAGIPVPDGNQVLEIVSGLRLHQLVLPGRHAVTDLGISFLSRLSLLSELDLTDYTKVTDHGVQQLSSLTRLKRLWLINTLVTDAGLPSLRCLVELQELGLDRTSVGSRGVAELIVCLPHLEVLGLASTQVGDSVFRIGLIHCTQLQKVNLNHTRITNNSLKYLKRMHLAYVSLDSTGITLSGITSLMGCTNLCNVRASVTRVIPREQVSDEEWEEQ
ncbi:uncharacterized protein ACB058_001684 isoform 1-T1 [Synchiropus picturatus]